MKKKWYKGEYVKEPEPKIWRLSAGPTDEVSVISVCELKHSLYGNWWV